MRILLLLIVVLFWANLSDGGRSRRTRRTLVTSLERVVDGDTIKVRGRRRYRVRLIYIDAPEIAQPFGRNASAFLHALMRPPGTRSPVPVTLQVKAEDTYGRLLSEVFLGRLSVNKWMVARGYAWCFHNRCPAAYKRAMRAARRSRLGLWAQERPEKPWKYRKRLRKRQRQQRRSRRPNGGRRDALWKAVL